jgi:hypothetical protein
LRESCERVGRLSVLSGTGILDAAREQLAGTIRLDGIGCPDT